MNETIKNSIQYFHHKILQYISDRCWIAGGCLRDYFSNVYTMSDIDVFSDDRNHIAESIKKIRKLGAKTIFRNKNVIRLKFNKMNIDFVKHLFNEPIDTINNFDFTVCCCALDKKDVYHHADFFMDLSKKQLKINKLPYPLSTLQRLQKYINHGYHICNGGLLELAKAIQQLDLASPEQNIFEFYPDGSHRFIRYD